MLYIIRHNVVMTGLLSSTASVSCVIYSRSLIIGAVARLAVTVQALFILPLASAIN